MHTAFAIDWIRATSKTHSVPELAKRFSYGFAFEDWSAFKPANGYSHALQHPYGHCVMWHIDREDMGVNVMMTGRALLEIETMRADNALSILKWLCGEEMTFTRLDLAIDIHESKLNIILLAECNHEGSVNNDPVLVTKGPKARGGSTLYLGGRQSEKFLRIYDKAKEQKDFDKLWIRAEVELKGKTATKIAHRIKNMSYDEMSSLTRGIIIGMYNPQNQEFQDAMNAEPVKVSTTKDTDHNTYEWLLNSVSKTIAKTMIELPHRNVWETLRNEVDKHIREMAARSMQDHQTRVDRKQDQE